MPPRRKKPAPPEGDAPIALPSGSEAALEALRGEIADLRRDLRGAADLPAVADRLHESAKLLAEALKDTPKADDFQPLADHLYEFAQTTPQLVDALRELPKPEDYDSLVQPMGEFARVAPALAEQLAIVMKSVAPLRDAVTQLRTTADDMKAPPSHAASDASHPALEAAATRMADAQQAIRDALASLPRDPQYRAVAEQLRTIASVSPSLTEWLHEVPKLSLPLGESIAALERAAEALAEGEAELRGAVRKPARPAPRTGARRS
jgi:hypothetical protein